MPRSDGEPIFFLIHRPDPRQPEVEKCLGALVSLVAAEVTQRSVESAVGGTVHLVDSSALTEDEISAYILEVRVGQ